MIFHTGIGSHPHQGVVHQVLLFQAFIAGENLLAETLIPDVSFMPVKSSCFSISTPCSSASKEASILSLVPTILLSSVKPLLDFKENSC